MQEFWQMGAKLRGYELHAKKEGSNVKKSYIVGQKVGVHSPGIYKV